MAHSIAPNPEKYQLASEDPEMHRKLAERYDVSPTGCHEWNRGISNRGYAITHHNRKTLSSHRLAYWIRFGAIPDHLVVDHMCHNRKCINTDHLRLLTQAENMAIALPAMSNTCGKGHPFEGDNFYVYTDPEGKPHRICRTCRYAIDQRAKQKRYPNRVPTGPRTERSKRAAEVYAGIGNDQLRQAALSAS